LRRSVALCIFVMTRVHVKHCFGSPMECADGAMSATILDGHRGQSLGLGLLRCTSRGLERSSL
jgi:hypothetical protein